jgi:hypothetical protein
MNEGSVFLALEIIEIGRVIKIGSSLKRGKVYFYFIEHNAANAQPSQKNYTIKIALVLVFSK